MSWQAINLALLSTLEGPEIRDSGKTMMAKLTLRDLEAMRQHHGIAQEDLLEDLGQVRVLEEVGISLQRWVQLRDVPMEYALVLRKYLNQEEEQEANQSGPGAAWFLGSTPYFL